MPDLLTIILAGLLLYALCADYDDESEATELERDPYRQALEAGSRISAMGFEAEQLMYREAIRAMQKEEEEER